MGICLEDHENVGIHRQWKLGNPEKNTPERRWEGGSETAGQNGVEGSTWAQQEEACWGLTHTQTEGRS